MIRQHGARALLQAQPVQATPGALNYTHSEPPVVLGCSGVGEVLSIADDVHDLHPGDIVFCDPMVPVIALS